MSQSTRRVRATVSASALGVVLLTAGTAAAQSESLDPSGLKDYRLGQGIMLADDMVVHPRVEAQTAYQPNVFYEDDSENPVDAGVMRIGVGADLTTNTQRDPESGMEIPSKMELQADLGLMWNQYLASESAATDQSNLGVNAMFALRVNGGGKLEFVLRDTFVRSVLPPPAETAADLARDKNVLMLGLIGRPGGGALEIYGNTSWTLDVFERDTAGLANRNMFEVAVGSRWQWLPKTQVNGEVSLGVIMVEGDAIKTDTGMSMPLRVTVGLSSLITPKFGTVLKAGYGNGFYEGANFSSYLALAELRYALGPTVRFAGGYSHDFADSLVGNFRADHAFFLRSAAQIAANWNLNAKAELRLRDYEGIPAMSNGVSFCSSSSPLVCNGGSRADTIFRFDVDLETQLSDWLVVALAYSLISNTTDAVTVADGNVDSLGYVWQEVVLRATAKF